MCLHNSAAQSSACFSMLHNQLYLQSFALDSSLHPSLLKEHSLVSMRSMRNIDVRYLFDLKYVAFTAASNIARQSLAFIVASICAKLCRALLCIVSFNTTHNYGEHSSPVKCEVESYVSWNIQLSILTSAWHSCTKLINGELLSQLLFPEQSSGVFQS